MDLAGKNKKMHRVQTSDFTERLEGGDTQTWFWCHQVEIEMDSKVHKYHEQVKGEVACVVYRSAPISICLVPSDSLMQTTRSLRGLRKFARKILTARPDSGCLGLRGRC